MARRKNRVLVLGNGPQINDIDFDRLDPTITTIGVNRIWLRYIPDYFYFHDYPILRELNEASNEITRIKLIDQSECYSSEWLKRSIRGPIPNWLRLYPLQNRSSFPDSVTNACLIYRNNKIRRGAHEDFTFYFAGVNLKWTYPSHFWKSENHNFSNKHDRKWYDVRFDLIYNNFEKMKNLDYKMISVTPGSRLNKLMRYESIGNLYLKS